MAKSRQLKTGIPEDPDTTLVGEVVEELRGHLAIIGKRREELAEGSFDPDLSSSAAAIGQILIAGAAERRAQRKAQGSLTREMVVTWLLSLTQGDRRSIVDEIVAYDERGPLL